MKMCYTVTNDSIELSQLNQDQKQVVPCLKPITKTVFAKGIKVMFIEIIISLVLATFGLANVVIICKAEGWRNGLQHFHCCNNISNSFLWSR